MASLLAIILDSAAAQLFIILFLGLVLGSFSTAVVYRTRHNQSWIWNGNHKDKSRSFCPSCRQTLGVKNLIPIFSWLFQKGRCCYCNVKIPLEYILLEIAVLLVCFSIYGVLGFTAQSLILIFTTPFFVGQSLLIVKYNMLSKLLLSIIAIGAVVAWFL